MSIGADGDYDDSGHENDDDPEYLTHTSVYVLQLCTCWDPLQYTCNNK